MRETAILYPMILLVGWTFLVMLQLPFRRFRAAFRRQVKVDDFKYGESERVPGDVSIPNRNYMNLLELPVLFYVACLTLYVTEQANGVLVTLAWCYVGMRILHSVIHLTYNHVMHRFAAFVGSTAILMAIWVLLVVALIRQAPA